MYNELIETVKSFDHESKNGKIKGAIWLVVINNRTPDRDSLYCDRTGCFIGLYNGLCSGMEGNEDTICSVAENFFSQIYVAEAVAFLNETILRVMQSEEYNLSDHEKREAMIRPIMCLSEFIVDLHALYIGREGYKLPMLSN